MLTSSGLGDKTSDTLKQLTSSFFFFGSKAVRTGIHFSGFDEGPVPFWTPVRGTTEVK
jgi:hypothetical protein